ncbi:hypothetical protein FOZ63_012230 [Perkinsus olseni]|uniref:Uncharacterized protein n=1 Tax=Perkinsus olseni TaxID=32597 RepID=A0A7J6SL53_PEROL|nr:hypothetical protein FOZ63_012230 [Perkinsus olseni]
MTGIKKRKRSRIQEKECSRKGSDWVRRGDEFKRRVIMGGVCLGFSMRSLYSPAFRWMLEPLLEFIPPSHRKKYEPTEYKCRTLKTTLLASERLKSDAELACATKHCTILYDSWKPIGSDIKICAVAYSYFDRQRGVFVTVPWKATSMEAGEKETGDLISSMVLDAAARVAKINIACISIQTDNAGNVRAGRELAMGELVGQQGSNSSIPPIFEGLVDAVMTVRKFLKLDAVSRIFKSSDVKGKQVLEPVDSRWMYHLLSLKSLLDNLPQIHKLLGLCRTRYWEGLTDIAKEHHEEVTALLYGPDNDLESRLSRTVRCLWPFKLLSDELQSDSCTVVKAMQRMKEVYEDVMRDPMLDCASRKIVKKRLKAAHQKRSWILLFDPVRREGRRDDLEWQKRECNRAIEAVRTNSDEEGFVHVEDSLGVIYAFFFFEGMHGTLDGASFTDYWSVFKNECSVSRVLYIASLLPSGTQSLERSFSSARFVQKVNRDINKIFDDVFLRHRAELEIQSSSASVESSAGDERNILDDDSEEDSDAS